MADKKIYKPKPISGFPEWLPEIRLEELRMLDTIRDVFESYGFCSIETPAVEEIEVLTSKGEDCDKEIYTLTRLQADENNSKEARVALHFDNTVPFARYVAMNFNELTFPFKRYQIQKAWRGERPQEGRFREFYQCDIDVINVDHVPLYFDAEMPAVVHEIFNKLNIDNFTIRISNRKVLVGYLEGLGVKDIVTATRLLDKLDKLGADKIKELLQQDCGLDESTADKALQLAQIKTVDDSFVEKVKALNVQNETLETGIEELKFIINNLPQGNVIIDLSIARGLDYYTGTVYETTLDDAPSFGSVCSGGRYDNLASGFINRDLPGVGISIGFSRLFAKLLKDGRFDGKVKSPADIMVTLPDEDMRPMVTDVCQKLRARGFKVDMFHSGAKMKKQMSYASKKGIPYVWLFDFDDPGKQSVKNMDTGEQSPANADSWVIN